ncbi:MAG TPA: SigB/SigF/SigG family RNA polymerase sigma factor [Streptosporangiaceae bacterium]|nr:SigB/SigF/SigG family RNA polymerase sigma factor [Streptosporangiaceae bacterium]
MKQMTTQVTGVPTWPDDLDALDDAALLTTIQSLPRGDRRRDAAAEVLVTRYQPLVRSCVLRYKNSTEPHEELMQVGYIGLLKAINNFDPRLGASLAGYAQPCVSGEIKRHFRDRRWGVHVKRSVQELRLELRDIAAELTAELGRLPSDGELAEQAGVSDDEVREVRQADMAFRAASLDAPAGSDAAGASLSELLGDEDPQLEHVLDMQAVWAHWGELAEREQKLLLMRFYGNMTQAEIGQRLGISQMHVSRLLAESLAYLRDRLTACETEVVSRA